MSENRLSHYIDTHVHVWSGDRGKYPIGDGFKSEGISPVAYSPEEVIALARPSGVDRIVLVQINFYGFDNSFMLEAIEKFPRVFRGVAVVDGKSEAPDEEMRRLALLGVSGVRLHPEEITPSSLDTAGFVKMFRCAADDGLVVCFLMNPESIEVINRQCQKFPKTQLVIDHIARIGMDGEIREPDVRALCALAKYPEVRIKLSGFYALGQAKPPHLDLAPLIKRMYETFGPRRLIWGSDCPFSLTRETYESAISVIRDRLDFISNEDREWILGRAAEQLFFG
jgi:predicted TIM-barrel fold metal-dependent hydrolase